MIEFSDHFNYLLMRRSPGTAPSGEEWLPYSVLNVKMLSIDSCPEVKSSIQLQDKYQFWTEVIPSLEAIPSQPSVEPTLLPEHCVINGGLGLHLSPGDANRAIQALFGTLIALVVLNVAFIISYYVHQMNTRHKKFEESYPDAHDNNFENSAGIKIASFRF